MTECDAMRSLILRSVDETLDEAGRAHLAGHLAICGACARALAVQAAMKRALADLPMATVSTDFASRVRERVAPPRWLDAFDWRVWTIRLAPIAALLALLAVLPATSDTTDVSSQSLSGVIDSWTADPAGASSEHMQLLLNPDADPNALLAEALEGVAR
jgi:anti-sigma factor RsiW